MYLYVYIHTYLEKIFHDKYFSAILLKKSYRSFMQFRRKNYYSSFKHFSTIFYFFLDL